MEIESFDLERYFARYEFSARYLLSASDCETLAMADLLALADAETRSLWQELRLGYTESAGLPLLRAEIAALYQRVASAGVLTAAPEEAILIAMNTLLRPGDRVVAVAPAYQSLTAVAKAIGCEVVDWPITLEGGRWTLSLETLARILPGARLLVLNFPHNPTGYLPERGLFEAAVGMAERAGAYIFSDEMYRLLEYDPAARLPAACDLSSRAVSLAGLSKAFGLAGLRTGWLASQDESLLARFQVFKDYTTICASAPGEILALIALRAKETIVARCLETVQRNRALAETFFAARAELFAWHAPDAGPVAFPGWLGAESVEVFCETAVERCGVMVVPGACFGGSKRHFRVGLGRAVFPAALDALAAALDLRGQPDRT